MISANHSAALTTVAPATRFVGTCGVEWRVECGPRPRNALAASFMKPGGASRHDSGTCDTGITDAAYRELG